ncbi:Peptidoglycan binding domain protein [Capnocytophaga cynodegmi]|uniref:Peptidoglycan binding domain protein n=2 Tax=Capnocytophaga cynodegmi TaxID=28189 RepID=A0A0B7HGA3_9FLAO|nr:Peptidoglycan binding domain protein [Capnocytophaga cynodegmi]
MYIYYIINFQFNRMKNYFFVLLGVFIILQSCKNQTPKELVEEIKQRETYESPKMVSLSDTTQKSFNQIFIKDSVLRKSVINDTKNFYKQNGFQTRWLYETKPGKLFYEYMKILENSENYGLNPETYNHKLLLQSVENLYTSSPILSEIEKLDKEITSSFLLLTNHLGRGRITKLAHGKYIWKRSKKNRDDLEILLKIKDDEKLSEIVDALHPQHSLYKRMSEKYKALKDTEEDSIIEVMIPQPKEFLVGYKHKSVENLRQNLAQKGYEAIPENSANQVDSTLLKALMQFQEDKGIKPDGIPGKSTLYYLNMTLSQKRDLLQLNMERIRLLNNDLGNDYIVVNIPEFKMFIYHKDSMIHQMNVIVGKEYTATPVFIDTLKYVEFRPTWTVPQSIIKNEMIPQIVSQSDPEKYQKRGYTLYENGKKIDPKTVDWKSSDINKRKFRFVEAPSARNSLGLVKFILTNDMSIYLHDTPSPKLFARENRALSHGCIRVEEPAELAYLLLKNQDDWTREKVVEAMNSGRNQRRIKLNTKFLVNMLYITAWVDEKGDLIIKNDIYGFDQEQLKELRKFQD